LRQLPANVAIYFSSAVFILLTPHILCRPHVLTFPLVAIWSIGLVRAQEKDNPPPLWTLPIFCLWANLHGSFLLGFVIIFVFCLLSTLRDGLLHKHKVRTWSIYIVGMMLATLAGPYGVYLATTALKVIDLGKLLYLVDEWRPQNFSHLDMFEIVMLSAISALIYLGVKLNAAAILILLGLLHMSLAHVRYTDYLAIIGSFLIITPVTQKLSGKELVINAKFFLPITLMIALVQSLTLIYLKPVITDNSAYPIAAIRAARNYGAHGRVFNSYNYGGALIEGEKVLIDSRQEFYSKSFLLQYLSLAEGSDFSKLGSFLKTEKIDWALLRRNYAVAKTVDKLPDWRAIYRDDTAIFYVRTS
jgi:hypothetical protein